MTGLSAPANANRAMSAGAETAPTTGVSDPGEIWKGVIAGDRWAVADLDFSFPTSASFYSEGYGSYDEPDYGFAALSATQIEAVRTLLGQIQEFTGLTFTETTETATDHALMRFALTDTIVTALGYFPAGTEEGGDSWYNSTGYGDPVLGSYAYNEGFMHEIGHTLGLAHGHDTGNVYGALPTERDSNEFSVMTYRDHVGDELDYNENETWGNPQSYMMYDIAALQFMYGADFSDTGNVWSGDSVYTFSTTTGEMFINGAGQGTPGGNRIFRTIWDGHGEDTYDLANYTTDLSIDLQPGEWSTFSVDQLADLDEGSRDTNLSRGNVANALLYEDDLRSLIENAVGGSGDDAIVGNVGANVLRGNAGADRLDGMGGDDTLFGGDGRDTLSDGAGADSLFVEADDDVVVAAADAAADDFDGGAGVDDLIYSAASSNLIIDLRLGTASGTDVGNDRVAGFERVVGGSGNDRMIGDAPTRLLGGGTGNDTLLGGMGNNALWGGAGNDNLRGFAGFDWLNGGVGDDRLEGGFNADTFVFGNGFGHDIIVDFDAFNPKERVDLSAVTAITSFADLAADHLSQVGANAVITDGSNTITLTGVNIADLNAGDFLF